MSTADPIKTLIAQWPNRQAFADQIGANVETVHKWAASGRIPSGWQARVVIAARDRGISYVTAEWMLSVHSQASSVS